MIDRTPLLALLLAALVVTTLAVLSPGDEALAGGDPASIDRQAARSAPSADRPRGSRSSNGDTNSGFLPIPERSSTTEPRAARPSTESRKISNGGRRTDGVFRQEADRIIARWLKQVSKLTKGKGGAHNVTVAMHALDRANGVELCARNIDVPLRPASNMKLVTSASALVLLGSDWEFATRFEAGGELRSGVLVGDLVVRAAGDPLYAADADGRTESRLDSVVEQLREAGIQRVQGSIVLDEGSFADPGPGPEWPPENQFWQTSCALAGGFTVNGGILVATVRAGAVGSAAAIDVHPSPHGLRERYGVTTVKKRINDVRVGANASGVTVAGKLGRSVGTVVADFAHPDPVDLFGAVLLDRLEWGGIRVEGEVRRQRGAAGGPTLAVLRSPLSGTLAPILRDSVNSVADQVFFAAALAVEGRADRAAARAATGRALTRLGVSDEGLVQVDGSGLSRAGRVTARQLTELLGAALEADSGALFRSALAVAGNSGTLEKRMRDTPAEGRVVGKTGWIRGASSLSGVASAQDGTERVFSILVSYPTELSGLNTSCFKPMQDELATALVELRP